MSRGTRQGVSRSVLALVLTALTVLLAAGCGSGASGNEDDNSGGNRRSFEAPSGGAESSSENIAAADIDQVLEAEESANTSCGLIRDQEGSDMPLEEAVEILISVLRQQPDGTVAAGVQNRQRNMTQIVIDVSNTLRTCPRPNEEASRRLQQAVEQYGTDI